MTFDTNWADPLRGAENVVLIPTRYDAEWRLQRQQGTDTDLEVLAELGFGAEVYALDFADYCIIQNPVIDGGWRSTRREAANGLSLHVSTGIRPVSLQMDLVFNTVRPDPGSLTDFPKVFDRENWKNCYERLAGFMADIVQATQPVEREPAPSDGVSGTPEAYTLSQRLELPVRSRRAIWLLDEHRSNKALVAACKAFNQTFYSNPAHDAYKSNIYLVLKDFRVTDTTASDTIQGRVAFEQFVYYPLVGEWR